MNSESKLRMHIIRQHGIRISEKIYLQGSLRSTEKGKFVCNLDFCKQELDSYKELIKHFKKHISEGLCVSCPLDCKKTYKKMQSLSGHLSRNHRNFVDHSIPTSSNVNTSNVLNFQNNEEEINLHNVMDANDDQNEINDDEEVLDSYLENLANLFLKLESQYLIPVNTIQFLITELQVIADQGRDHQKVKLRSYLQELQIPDDKIEQIAEELFINDIFWNCSKKLNSSYKRYKFYKERHSFIEPIEIKLNDKCHFQYVPVIETLKRIVKDKSVFHEWNIKKESEEGMLEDFTDGTVFQENQFFKDNPDAIQIILYQDSFEIVNPIGP